MILMEGYLIGWGTGKWKMVLFNLGLQVGFEMANAYFFSFFGIMTLSKEICLFGLYDCATIFAVFQ